MSLLEDWRNKAYDQNADPRKLKELWDDYFKKEREIYKVLLKDPDLVVKGTVQELADRYNVDLMTMVGFLDGINDSLLTPNPIETMTADTEVSLGFDKKKLYMNMVDAGANWLYGLPEWNAIFTEDEQKALYHEQKVSKTVVKPKKIGRNDPCPCGSGRKYKYCHGRKGAEPLDPALLK